MQDMPALAVPWPDSVALADRGRSWLWPRRQQAPIGGGARKLPRPATAQRLEQARRREEAVQPDLGQIVLGDEEGLLGLQNADQVRRTAAQLHLRDLEGPARAGDDLAGQLDLREECRAG